MRNTAHFSLGQGFTRGLGIEWITKRQKNDVSWYSREISEEVIRLLVTKEHCDLTLASHKEKELIGKLTGWPATLAPGEPIVRAGYSRSSCESSVIEVYLGNYLQWEARTDSSFTLQLQQHNSMDLGDSPFSMIDVVSSADIQGIKQISWHDGRHYTLLFGTEQDCIKAAEQTGWRRQNRVLMVEEDNTSFITTHRAGKENFTVQQYDAMLFVVTDE